MIDATVSLYKDIPLYPGTQHYILLNSEQEWLDNLNTNALVRRFTTVLDPRNLTTGGKIKLNGSYAHVSTCNYMYITIINDGTTFHRYAFITDIQYINDNNFEVSYQIDNFTSWIYQLNKTFPGYVIREHTNNDTIGANKADEGLDVGTLLYRQNTSSQDTIGTTIIVATTKDLNGNNFSGGTYNNVANGNGLLAFYPNDNAFTNYINAMNEKGFISAISNIFMVPRLACGDQDFNATSHQVNNSFSAKQTLFFGTKDYYLDGYTAKNNKMYTYPYCYPVVINNQGQTLQLEFDLWTQTNDIEFQINAIISQGECCNLYPYKYASEALGPNRIYTIPMGNYPSVSWQNDQYSNWLAQTQNSRENNIVQTGIATGVNALTSLLAFDPQGVGNAIVSGSSSIASQLATQLDRKVLPNLVQNSSSFSNLNMANNLKSFHVYTCFPTYEYAKRIDDYFSAFGYKTLQLKQPNFYGRKSWNYLQIDNYTIHAESGIPLQAQQEIRRVLQNGVTLWHTTNLGNYNLDNSII